MGTFRSSALALLSLSLLVGSSHAEDPLPLVELKSDAAGTSPASTPDLFAAPRIAMAVVPLSDLSTTPAIDTSDPSTLRTILHDAASANDRPLFDTALTRAQAVVETLPLGDARNSLRRAISIYSDLQKVWGYAATDRYGAFFDEESLPGLYDRLDSDYAGYGSYIAQYTVTDQRGRVFYPTAETRTFLQQQAGGSGIQLASRRPLTAQSAETLTTAGSSSTTVTLSSTKPAIVAANHHARRQNAVVTPKPEATPAAQVVPQPAPIAVATTAIPAAVTQQPLTRQAAPAPIANAALTADIRRTTNPPRVQPAARPEAKVLANPNETQGLLFIIIALIAIGVMTIWARTPQSSSTVSSASTQPYQLFTSAEPFANGEGPAPKKSEADVVQIKQNRAS